MTSLEGCAGGGWTLVMKVDGSKNTFAYNSLYWSNREMYNPVGGTSGFDFIETKLPTYWSTSFNEICIGINTHSDPKFLKIKYAGTSLLSLLKDGVFRPIYDVGREDWKSLIPSYSSLQNGCDQVGFNNQASNLKMYPAARIGIIADEDPSCKSPDSFIGIGGTDYLVHNDCFLGYLTFPVSGNLAACAPDNGKVNIKSMGYILVR
ncbi:uncharacterized skeletal organic matrix protein 5-like [Dendronephthya gigantea]|uniref:uncharacterized skeletal organic matrix protein 5-like n=1 Tax=Dendronephthya gigantea TaxID=151771 RepID=UPI00106BEBAC|nr:uncharacterized skeletal organic matrix protein 5-like [Dendronephthya gigantea]